MKILIREGTKAVSALSRMHSPWRQMTMLAPPKPERLPLRSPHSCIPLHKCLHMCSCLQPPSQCLMVQHTTHSLCLCLHLHISPLFHSTRLRLPPLRLYLPHYITHTCNKNSPIVHFS